MAEHVMAMTLSLAKHLPQRHAATAEGRFDRSPPALSMDGAVCAILGFGGIGIATARLMRAFGTRVYALNRTGQTAEPVDFVGTLDDLDDVLPVADVVVISLPLTQATRGLIGARELSSMKPAAIVVNVGPGRDHRRGGALPAFAHPPGVRRRDRHLVARAHRRRTVPHRLPLLRTAEPHRLTAQFQPGPRHPAVRRAGGRRERAPLLAR
jgi:D-isomer specific 2-hydroxyacid dehydrogenase, NAD binding domain